jgi:osmotically-inducible protein OsmY
VDVLVATPTNREIATKTRPPAIEIDRRVEDLFRRSGYLALRDVSCVAYGDVLYLRGRLPSYYLKQVAQEVAASVVGARRLVNIIEVSASAGRTPVGFDQAQSPSNPLC